MKKMKPLAIPFVILSLVSCTTTQQEKSHSSDLPNAGLSENEQINAEATTKYLTIDRIEDYSNIAQIALPNEDITTQRQTRLNYQPLDVTEDLIRNFDKEDNADDRKVIGGTVAKIGQFPWHVALELKGVDFSYGYFCGGTLIDGKTVITAAHCFYKTNPIRQFHFEDNITIGYGSNLQNKLVSVEVAEIVPHPRYTHEKPDSDIAIVKLKTAILPSEDVSFANLPDIQSALDTGYPLDLYGFGRHTSNSSDVSRKLLWGKAPYLSKEFCNDFELYDGELPSTHFCAGDPVGGAEACKGDSGGGLIDPTKQSVIGITSFGDPECILDGRPTVYTDVRQFLKWISRRMEKKSDVIYYQKESDPLSLLKTLESLSTNVKVIKSQFSQLEKSNAVWVGSKVEFGQFKHFITELIKSGTHIKRIAPSCKNRKQRTTDIIQVGTSARATGNDILPITLEFVQNADDYQELFVGSEGCE